VRNDSLGRFFTSSDGRKNSAYDLGTKMYTEDQFISHIYKRLISAKSTNNTATLTVLIGAPGSGKSSFLDDNEDEFKDNVVISRDDYLETYAREKYGNKNYSELWKLLSYEDQKNIDALLESKFVLAKKSKKDMVVDMTSMSSKSQRRWVNKINSGKSSYKTKAIVFCPSEAENQRRLDKRKKETGKSIPDFVLKNMKKSFMVPDYSIFDEIEYIF